MIVFGAIHLALLLICLKFIVPKEFFQDKSILQDIRKYLPYLLIIFGVVALHLFEVNIVDPSVTEWVGHDFAKESKGI
jgi:uncharacterized membrane protein